MIRPSISVIIPIYNRHDCIKTAINTVLNAKKYCNYNEVEIIVVDDCSEKPFDYLCDIFKGLTLLRLPFNVGAGVAREYGLKTSVGEWILYLDSDDEVYPRIFEEFLKIPNIKLYDMVNFNTNIDALDDSGGIFRTEDSLHGKMFRKSAIIKNNIHFHPRFRFYEDTYYYKAFTMSCRKVYDHPYVGYHLIENEKSTTKNVCDDWLNRMYYNGVDVLCSLYENYQNDIFDKFDIIRNANDLMLRMRDKYDDSEELAYYRIFDSLHYVLGMEQTDDLMKLECFNLIPDFRKDKAFDIFEKWRNKNKQIKLSIIVPLYNSYNVIDDTIRKLYEVIKEHINECEIILTDDNSDEPWKYQNLLNDYPEIIFLNNSKRGYMGENRNRGIRWAHGEYIMFLDHDDEIKKKGIDFGFGIFSHLWGVIELGVIREMPDGTIKNTISRQELIHGRFYRRDFLLENNIFFNPKLKTSEDSYFMRKVYYFSRDDIYIKDDIILYNWKYVKNSTMNKLYNNRDYIEEYYIDHVRAAIWAFDSIDKIEERYKIENFCHLLCNGNLWYLIWKENSKNFSKFNIKVNMALLLEIEHRYGTIYPNSIDELIFNFMKNSTHMSKYFGVGNSEYPCLEIVSICHNLIEKLSPKQKKEIRCMLDENNMSLSDLNSEEDENLLTIMEAIADLYEMISDKCSTTEH